MERMVKWVLRVFKVYLDPWDLLETRVSLAIRVRREILAHLAAPDLEVILERMAWMAHPASLDPWDLPETEDSQVHLVQGVSKAHLVHLAKLGGRGKMAMLDCPDQLVFQESRENKDQEDSREKEVLLEVRDHRD